MKVGICELIYAGRFKKFEVHYSPKDETFSVRIPEAAIKETRIDPRCDSQAAAVKKAEEILRAWEKSAATRRRVMIVYCPAEAPFHRHRHNGFDLEYLVINFGYRKAIEVTLNGERHFINDQGRADHIPDDDCAVIEWTKEREEFFAGALDRLRKAKDSIREFCQTVEKRPELLEDPRALVMLMGGKS